MSKNIVDISSHLHGSMGLLVKNINVFLTDLKGHILFEGKNTYIIDISQQPKGYYIAFLTDLNGSLIKKIKVIKQ
jgi:hypothetical protein